MNLDQEIETIFDTLNYHNCGLLYRNRDKIIEDLMNMYKNNSSFKEMASIYNTPYWNYIMNIRDMTESRIYGKFMIFTYEPEILTDSLKDIVSRGLSPIIKYSTNKPSFQTKRNKDGSLSKSKIICIYTDRSYRKIRDLAIYLVKNEIIKKDIPFQASYDYGYEGSKYQLKKKMMLSDFEKSK